MALLRRYAPSVELSLRVWPQLPLILIRHRARGLSLLTLGDGSRQHNWGVIGSAANPVISSSVVSAWPQHSPAAARTGWQHRQVDRSNQLLQHSSRAQAGRRLFCSYSNWLRKGAPERGTVRKFAVATNKLKGAVLKKDQQGMLEGLGELRVFAEKEDYCEDDYKAKELLLTALLPLCGKHGGLHDDVVKESLAVACLLLKNAPVQIATKVRAKILLEEEVLKAILERIRDCADEVRTLADMILTQPPSAPN